MPVCRGQRLTLCVLLYCSPLKFPVSLSLTPVLTNWLAWWAPELWGSPGLCVPSARITDVPLHTSVCCSFYFLTRVLESQAQVFMLTQQELTQLSGSLYKLYLR